MLDIAARSHHRAVKGFTLAELMIVIAVILLLVTIAIPSFAGLTSEARASTCMYNRRALKSTFTTQFILEDREFTDGEKQALTAAEAAGCPCPDGGTITYSLSEGVFVIHCSIHDPEGEETGGGTTGGGGIIAPPVTGDISQNIDKITEILDANKSFLTAIDSTSGSPTLARVNADFTAAGINMAVLGATSWAYDIRTKGSFLYWTDVDVTKINPDNSEENYIPVIRFNCATRTYTVWYSRISTKTSDFTGVVYNYICPPQNTQYIGSKNADISQQIYDNAVIWLLEAQGKA